MRLLPSPPVRDALAARSPREIARAKSHFDRHDFLYWNLLLPGVDLRGEFEARWPASCAIKD